ncbi:hypothetical protein SAMN05216188_101355 [Lentzea xinjiangensis]|uniref:Uncharacterized protein n=1 Tax=Lentzea xinjiangensis TaxID=402600 RepID=A0A1H9ACY3_9PSEU|nr:hypothetical protein [Lentzea xinjiangensis]SEP74475.1 hypothetical protein SAMN05216188_101355 [Lentzea xinjiangensis]
MNRIVAPYITMWSAEQDVPCRVIERPGRGIGYVNEILTDRDARGVLWRQTTGRQGLGRPEFGKVHPLRQRQAMDRLLCQVCGGPADETQEGVLFLLRDFRDDWPRWPEGMGSTEPPVCLRCVALSLRLCPALRRGAVAIRVREFPIAGVRGTLYRHGLLSPVTDRAVNMPYDDPAVRWVLASALIRELRNCAIVPFEEIALTPVG